MSTGQPVVAGTEATGPLVLNSAPGTLPPSSATADAAGPATMTTPAAPVPASAPASVAKAPTPAQPTALQPVPAPSTAAVAATTEDGEFPNINKPPAQPGGTLLPEATRAQIIADLEKLRAGQPAGGGGGGGGNPSELADQATTHGQAAIQQIEECSADGALQNNPACAPD